MNPRLIILSLLFAGMPILASDPAPKPDTEGFERYRIVIKRNIFLKDKSKAGESALNRHSDEKKSDDKTQSVVAKDGPLPLRAESQMVLNGIVSKDGNIAAFFENRKDGTTLAVHAGDKLINGTVSSITLDSVDFSNNGISTIITIGKALDGTVADPKTADSFKTPAPGSTDAAPSGENALLEKMRKRRQEEMRK